MAAVCELCGKRPGFGMSVSFSHRRTKRRWNPNIQRVRALVGGSSRRISVCTSCIRAGKVVKPPRRRPQTAGTSRLSAPPPASPASGEPVLPADDRELGAAEAPLRRVGRRTRRSSPGPSARHRSNCSATAAARAGGHREGELVVLPAAERLLDASRPVPPEPSPGGSRPPDSRARWSRSRERPSETSIIAVAPARCRDEALLRTRACRPQVARSQAAGDLRRRRRRSSSARQAGCGGPERPGHHDVVARPGAASKHGPAFVGRAGDGDARRPAGGRRTGLRRRGRPRRRPPPRSSRSMSPSRFVPGGATSPQTAWSGRPPMAAMSLTFTASAFQPASARLPRSRSKWTPSTTRSRANRRWLPGERTTAASSPIHTSPAEESPSRIRTAPVAGRERPAHRPSRL